MNPTRDETLPAQTLGLDALPKGVPATVASLAESGHDGMRAVVLRLMEIGFLPGEPVRVIASGFPSADPLAVRIGQATFALRRHEAALVQVRVTAAAGADA